ncbi:MAG: hypothetical protein IT539_07815 [Bradyrhizobiaceae bacterium]|nr:hypothetical protein [Bradyrhizobiaceae bacterium]
MIIDRLMRQVGEYFLVKSLMLKIGSDPAEAKELDYHPMPWFGRATAQRSEGTLSRLSTIETELEKRSIRDGVVLDIGSHFGFFSLKLAEKGFFVYGAESIRERVFFSFLAAHRLKYNFNPIALKIDRSNVSWLPGSDITLCLSVWHHWVRNFGLDNATEILAEVARKTKRVMFFDSGEGEMGERYSLPYGENDDAAAYLENYLGRLPRARSVSRLGVHQAFSPKDAKGVRSIVFRTLFCVEMKG